MRRGSIGVKLLLYFLLVMIIPMSILGIMSFRQSKSILINNMELTSVQTLDESKKGFVNYLKRLSLEMDILTRKNDFKHFEVDGNVNNEIVDSAQNSLVAALKTCDGAVRARYFTTNNRVLTAWLTNNSEGEVVGDYKIEENIDLSNEKWYKDALKNENRNGVFAVYSEPYTDKETNKKIITVAQQVKSKGTFVGVVTIDVDFSTIESYIQNIGLLNTGYVLLVDENGNILVDNDNNKYFKDSLNNLEVWQKIQSEDNGSYKLNINGDKIHIMQLNDEITKWKLVGIVSDNEISNNVSQIKVTTVAVSIIGAIIGVIFSLIMTNSIKKQISILSKAFKHIAGGDFTKTIKVEKRDEFGQLGENFNIMVENVSKLMKNVEESSYKLLDVSDELFNMSKETTSNAKDVSKAVESVSDGALKQSESTEAVTNHVENLANQLLQSENFNNTLNETSSKTENLSMKGIRMLDTLIKKTDKTKENFRITEDMVNEVVKSVKNIDYISNAIADITEQTNLLSLNASIEAARAGEAGKGFAVVADKIRDLSDQSKKSTNEIKAIIENINTNVKSTLTVFNESKDIRLDEEKSIVETKALFNSILESIRNLLNELDEINELNRKMFKNKDIVVQKVENILEISKESAALSEGAADSVIEVTEAMSKLDDYTENLKKIANTLKTELNKFTL
ncbi:MAG: methyl-accepting chemotaxis protein [Clostridium sp.]